MPGSGRAPGEGNGNLLQGSCLENPLDGGAWQATVHGVAESDTTEVTEHAHVLSESWVNHTNWLHLWGPPTGLGWCLRAGALESGQSQLRSQLCHLPAVTTAGSLPLSPSAS